MNGVYISDINLYKLIIFSILNIGSKQMQLIMEQKQQFHFKQPKKIKLRSILLLKDNPYWPVEVIKLISFGTYKIQRVNLNKCQFANSHDLYEWNERYESDYSSVNNRKLTLAMKKAVKLRQKALNQPSENQPKIESQFDNDPNQDNFSIKEEEEEDEDPENKSITEKEEPKKINFIDKLFSITIQSLFDDMKKGNITKVVFVDERSGEKKETTYRPKFLLMSKLQYLIQDLAHLIATDENVSTQILSNIKKIMSSELITPLDYIYSNILKNIWKFEKELQNKPKKKIPSKIASCYKYFQQQREIIKNALITYLDNFSIFQQVQKDISQMDQCFL